MWIKCKDEFRNEGLPVFVKTFTVKKRLIRCELKITATGIFGVKVNGKTLSDRFMPGWSNYRKHIDVCTYDITEYLTDGSENEIAVTVANGWYSGKLGYGNKTNVFGNEKRLLASIFLVYENGDTEKIESDESWKTVVSDVVSADFFDGEIIDAGRRKAMKQSGNAVKAEFSVPLQNYEREPVCVTERIKPQLVYGDETTLRYDFGYNFAGGVKVIAKGRKGSRIVVKYGETLDENGNVYTANLRRAKCTDEFILYLPIATKRRLYTGEIGFNESNNGFGFVAKVGNATAFDPFTYFYKQPEKTVDDAFADMKSTITDILTRAGAVK